MLLTQSEIKRLIDSVKDGSVTIHGFDIETSISQFYGFATGEQYVDADQLVPGTETKIMLIQYIEGLEKKAQYLEADIKKSCCHVTIDDTKMLQKYVELVNKADIVIGQNSKSFDEKTIRERCKVLGLPPIKIDFMLDILPLSKRSVRAMSHRLDYRSRQQGLGGKLKTHRDDWIGIVEGRAKLSDVMIPYGCKDIEDTMKLFWKELPYYDFPVATYNKLLTLISDPTDICIECKAKKHKSTDVTFIKTTKNKGKFVCNNCDRTWEYIKEDK